MVKLSFQTRICPNDLVRFGWNQALDQLANQSRYGLQAWATKWRRTGGCPGMMRYGHSVKIQQVHLGFVNLPVARYIPVDFHILLVLLLFCFIYFYRCFTVFFSSCFGVRLPRLCMAMLYSHSYPVTYHHFAMKSPLKSMKPPQFPSNSIKIITRSTSSSRSLW